MHELNRDKVFASILAKIESGEIKTTHQLRLVLDGLADAQDIRGTLKLLASFREWLLEQGIELSTSDGMVSLNKE